MNLPKHVEAVDEAFRAMVDAMDYDFESNWRHQLQADHGALSFRSNAHVKTGQLKQLERKPRATKEATLRYSGVNAHAAFLAYMDACDAAAEAGRKLCAQTALHLRGLMDGYFLPLVLALATHYSALLSHCKACKTWCLAEGEPLCGPTPGQAQGATQLCVIEGFRPFWSSAAEAVSNSIEFTQGRAGIILTGGNAFGKSTLLRSIAACLVLRNAGLLVPCSAMRGGFESVFLKLGNADDPLRRKSSFVSEAADISEMLRLGDGSNSLFLLDELLRGTSTMEGASLAGALCEHLDASASCFILSTHFHEIYGQDLNLGRTRYCSRAVGRQGDKTYKLEKGQCLDTWAYQDSS